MNNFPVMANGPGDLFKRVPQNLAKLINYWKDFDISGRI